MRIGIDGRFLGTAGGFSRYTEQLLKRLEELDRDNDYVVFLTRQNFDLYQPANPKFKKILANCRWYTLKEQLVLPWKIWRANLDLMHFVSWNAPLLNPAKFVVTIHDLILLKYPSRRASTLNPLLYWLKNLAYKITLKRAVAKAQKIIATSEFTKNDLIKTFKLDSNKIEVIYQAPFTKVEPGPLSSPLPKPYLLYVGVAYPHKNLEFLIEAFSQFSKKYANEYHLVLVGEENYFYKKLISRSEIIPSAVRDPAQHMQGISRSARDDRATVVFTGRVSDEELSTIYTHASLYVFPSLYEGFGLPPLEAMTYGVPVLAANNSCLPEILGEATLYFDPRNLEELVELINQILKDKNLQNRLKEAGFEQIKKYSWITLAKKTLQAYQNSV